MEINNHIPTDGFPELVQHKGVAAKIYRARNRDRFRYEVRDHDPEGSLQRDTFDEHAGAAQKHANVIVKQLTSGELPLVVF